MSERQPTIGLGMIVKEITPDTWTNLWPLLGGQIDQLVIVTTHTPYGDQNHNNKEAVDARVSHGVRIETPHFPWVDDFAAARNYAFSFLDTDWLFWIDDDDIVRNSGNVRKAVAEADAKGIGCIHLVYEYRHDSRGQPTVIQTRERFMRRDLEWTWKDRVHEYCAAAKPHAVGLADDVTIVHQNDEPNTERNLRLLQMMLVEDPDNARLLAALGDTYQSMGEFEKSLSYTRQALDRVDNLDVKWTCATELARTYIKLKEYDDAIQWCHVAIDIHPDYSLAYLLLAHIAWFRDQDADRAILFLNDADADGRVEAPLVVHRLPADYTINRWDTEHRVLAEKGRWADALTIIHMALEHLGAAENPRSQMFSQWFYFFWYYTERVNCERSIAGATAIVDHLCRRGDTLRARRFLEEDLPLSIREDRRILKLYERIEEFTAHVFDETKYQEFYDNNHSDPEDADHVMNGIEYEPYRMNVLLERLKARGAKRILDVGCGAGEPAIFLAQHGFLVTGLDINNLSIQEARKRAKAAEKNKSIKKMSCEFRTGSLETMGPEDLGKYDAVVMMELIEHLHPSKVPFYFGAAEDMLNPGGAVFATTPGMAVGDIPGVWDEFPRDHVQEFSRQELERLILDSTSRRQKFPISLYKIYDPAVSVPGFASWFIEYEWIPEEADLGENWRKPVVIYTGPGLEEWKPTDPDERGLGGSETWAAKTAREFRKLGHPVVVYAESTGVWEGVIYRHHSLYRPEAPFVGSPAWLTMVSRHCALLDERPATELFWFMAHDVDYGEEMTPERWRNIDRYMVLSEWQHNHTLEVYSEDDGSALIKPMPFDWQAKMSRFSNGIEPSFYSGIFLCEECSAAADAAKSGGDSVARYAFGGSRLVPTQAAADQLAKLGIELVPSGSRFSKASEIGNGRSESGLVLDAERANDFVKLEDGSPVPDVEIVDSLGSSSLLGDFGTNSSNELGSDSLEVKSDGDVVHDVEVGASKEDGKGVPSLPAGKSAGEVNTPLSVKKPSNVVVRAVHVGSIQDTIHCNHYRKAHRFVWSSSPDRGLDHLLSMWPEILDMWPDAELLIAYGWDNIDAMIGPERPWLAPFKRRVIGLSKQSGVRWLGRIGQRDLAGLHSSCSFWLYPATLPAELGSKPWNETFCITALEAQLAGVIPVMPRHGALPERFYFGAMEDDSSLWIDRLEALDKEDEVWPSHIRWHQDMIATEYNWSRVTEQLWSKAMMESVVREELDATPA